MVEETNEETTQSKPRTKTKRPKAVYLWSVNSVLNWYRLHCNKYPAYEDLFAKHDITGRALLRLTDHSLQRMGITDNSDREFIYREIVKQRLRSDVMEIRDMQRSNNHH